MLPITEEVPKPLIKVGGKAFLEHILEALPKKIDEIILVVGYRGDLIRNFVGQTYKGKKVNYVEQRVLNGTGPAVGLTRKFFKKPERFFIVYGDEVLTKKDVERCLNYPLAWLCRKAKDPKKSGIVTLSSSGRILEVEEKPEVPKSNLTGAGLILVNTDLFKFKAPQHPSGERYLTSMMDKFVRSHVVRAVVGRRKLSFSSPGDIEKFVNRYLK